MMWYGVRGVLLRSLREQLPQERLFEETIRLVRATSPDEAIRKVAQDIRANVLNESDEDLGLYQAFEVGSGRPNDGDEVFSLYRSSLMEPEDYVASFFQTGSERQRLL